MDLNKLEQLFKLKEKGTLTELEFEEAKREVMKKKSPIIPELKDDKFGTTDSNYYMLMHIGQFLGVIIPFFGVIIPILMWMVKKEEDPKVDAHGKNIMNWIVSSYIYLFICAVLIFAFIDIFMISILIPILFMFIFPIIGAVKAKDGKIWKYPFSFPFFK